MSYAIGMASCQILVYICNTQTATGLEDANKREIIFIFFLMFTICAYTIIPLPLKKTREILQKNP